MHEIGGRVRDTVVPGTRRGGSFEKETWLIEVHGEYGALERNELNK